MTFWSLFPSIPLHLLSRYFFLTQLLIDNALLSFSRNRDISKRVREIEFRHAQFPVGENKYIDNYDIVTTIGAFYFMITPLFAFLFIQNEIVREKEFKLRQGSSLLIQVSTSWELLTAHTGSPGLQSRFSTL